MRRLFRILFPYHALGTTERRLIALLWLLGVLQGLAQTPLSAILPFTRRGLGLTEGEMSLVLSVTRLASLGAIGFSVWGDRSGRRRPFLAAFVTLMCASGMTALAPGAATFTIAQAAVRAATTAVGTLSVVLLAEQITPHLRAFSIGLYAAAGSLGAGLGQLMLPVAALGDNAWRIAFATPVLGLAAFPILRKVRESPLVTELSDAVPVRDMLIGSHGSRFWMAGMAGLLASAFPAVGLAFTNERLVGTLGLSPGRATAIALTGGTMGAMGFWIGGRLADVWGRRPTTILSIGASIAGGMLLFRVSSVPMLVLAVFLGAFGSFAYLPAASSHRAELFPTPMRATAGSAASYLATVGSAMGLAVGAVTIDRIGLADTMSLLAIPMGLAGVLTMTLPETRGIVFDQSVEAPTNDDR